jgi:hypothetical protein
MRSTYVYICTISQLTYTEYAKLTNACSAGRHLHKLIYAVS